MIAILGMHRSGTSSLAGCLEELGLAMGEVVNSSPHNPKGNKENRQLRALNETLLVHNGGAWDDPPARIEWDAGLRRQRDELLRCQSAGHRFWGFKDPRSILTLPFWMEACPQMKLVATFRNPAAVTQSLLRRSGMHPRTDPLELWKIYNRRLIKIIERHACPVVCFDRSSHQYIVAVRRVARKLGLAQADSALGFFDDKLRNEIEPDMMLDTEALDIYRSLERLASAVSGND